jgi:hypothetical protein
MDPRIAKVGRLLDETPDSELLPILAVLVVLVDHAWARYKRFETTQTTKPPAEPPAPTPAPAPMDCDLDVEELAKLLNMSTTWVRRNKKEIGYTLHGNSIRFPLKNVERYRARAERAAAA